MDLLRVLARAPHGSLQPLLVWVATDSTPTSASIRDPTVSCRAGCGPPGRAPPPPADQQRARIENGALTRYDRSDYRPGRGPGVSRARDRTPCRSRIRVHTQQRRACALTSMRLSSGEDVWRPRWRGLPSRPLGRGVLRRVASAAREARDLPARTDGRMRLALRVSIIAWGSAPRRHPASVAVGPGAEVLLAGSARNPKLTPSAAR